MHKAQTHVKNSKPGAKILLQSTEIMKSYSAGSLARPPSRPIFPWPGTETSGRDSGEAALSSQRTGAGLIKGWETGSRESFRKRNRLKLEGEKAKGLKDSSWLVPSQCLTLFHTRHLITKAHSKGSAEAREGWVGRQTSRRRKAEASEHSHGYSHRQEGGSLSQANLRELPFSSRGGNTAGAKEDKIPAGLHTHSGAGGKAAQSRDLGVQRGRMQRCHGGSPGMAFLGSCCGHCRLAPEEAAVTRLMRGQSCAESSTEPELRRRHPALRSALRFLPSQAILF